MWAHTHCVHHTGQRRGHFAPLAGALSRGAFRTRLASCVGPESTMPDDRPVSSLTRFKSGGVVDFSFPQVVSGTHREGTTSRPIASGSTHQPNTTTKSSMNTMNTMNVGFRMLRNAGWKVGDGLGKANQGETEPVRVVRKSSRRGVGHSEVGDLKVVGDFTAKKGRSSDAKDNVKNKYETKTKTRPAGVNLGDEKKRKRARCDSFARAAGRAFNDSGDTLDTNPLFRVRVGRTTHVSENNPLRGLF